MEETLIPLTDKEREFLIRLISSVTIPGVTLENLPKNKTIQEMLVLLGKLKSDSEKDTMKEEDGGAELPSNG